VDQNSLRLLADSGFKEYLPDEFLALAEWCWDFGVASADARYFVLSRVFCVVYEAFGDAGVVTAEVYRGLDDVLSRSLKAIIDEQDPLAATLLAKRGLDDTLSVIQS
jgi:hypothetical protein